MPPDPGSESASDKMVTAAVIANGIGSGSGSGVSSGIGVGVGVGVGMSSFELECHQEFNELVHLFCLGQYKRVIQSATDRLHLIIQLTSSFSSPAPLLSFPFNYSNLGHSCSSICICEALISLIIQAEYQLHSPINKIEKLFSEYYSNSINALPYSLFLLYIQYCVNEISIKNNTTNNNIINKINNSINSISNNNHEKVCKLLVEYIKLRGPQSNKLTEEIEQIKEINNKYNNDDNDEKYSNNNNNTNNLPYSIMSRLPKLNNTQETELFYYLIFYSLLPPSPISAPYQALILLKKNKRIEEKIKIKWNKKINKIILKQQEKQKNLIDNKTNSNINNNITGITSLSTVIQSVSSISPANLPSVQSLEEKKSDHLDDNKNNSANNSNNNTPNNTNQINPTNTINTNITTTTTTSQKKKKFKKILTSQNILSGSIASFFPVMPDILYGFHLSLRNFLSNYSPVLLNLYDYISSILIRINPNFLLFLVFGLLVFRLRKFINLIFERVQEKLMKNWLSQLIGKEINNLLQMTLASGFARIFL